MATDQDFLDLAARMRAADGSAARGQLMFDHLRHELDLARSSIEWDNVKGLSEFLGRHAELLTNALGVDNGQADSAEPREDTVKPVRRPRP